MTVNREAISALSSKWSVATAEAPGFDEERSRQRWVEAFSRRYSLPAPVHRRAQQVWVLAVAAAVLLTLSGAWWWKQSQPELGVAPGAWLETRLDEKLPMRFAEGSEVVLQGSSKVHVESVDPRGARMVVERGSVSARIIHRHDTRWAFVAGPFHVRVTGTELAVDWDPAGQQFSVAVRSGSVVVSGPLLEGGRTVAAGERCSVRVATQHLEITRVSVSASAAEPATTQQPPVVDIEELPIEDSGSTMGEGAESGDLAAGVSPQLPKWRRLEREGRYREAFDAAKRVGLELLLASGSASELMSLARAARFTGRDQLATRCLHRVRKNAPGSGDSATAAFLLGRAAAPADAANWFSTYLREQPSGLLSREASGRLIESLHRAGRFAEARGAALRYLASYPAGPHAAFAHGVLGDRE